MSTASSRPWSCGTVAEHWLFAALYDRMTGPLEQGVPGERRAALLADLGGEILDVGAGTGANLPHFRAASLVVAAEPDAAMRRRLAAKLAGAPVPAELTGDVNAGMIPRAAPAAGPTTCWHAPADLASAGRPSSPRRCEESRGVAAGQLGRVAEALRHGQRARARSAPRPPAKNAS